MYLFLLINVFKYQNTSVQVAETSVGKLKRIDRSANRVVAIKKILLWNPWYGDFGFQPDDEVYANFIIKHNY